MRSIALLLCLLAGLALSGAAENWSALKKAGDQALARKDYAAAIQSFERLVRGRPESADAHNALGFALFMDGRQERAIFEFRKALALNRGQTSAQRNLILAVGKKAIEDAKNLEFTEALGLLDEIESNYPWHPDIGAIRFFRGQIEFYRGRPAAGIAEWRILARQRPNSATALFLKAHDLQLKGKLQQAGQQYQTALKKKPDEGIFRNYYALLLDELGKTELAVLQLELALEDPPPYIDLRLNLAGLYQRQADMEQALTQLRAARQMRPDYASVHLRLAALYLFLGRGEEARRELGLALAAETRPAMLVLPTTPGPAAWLGKRYLGACPLGHFEDPGSYRLKIQEPGTAPRTVQLNLQEGKVLIVQAGPSLAVEQQERSALLPRDKPAASFVLKDRNNKRWRSFQHVHRRPILLMFWRVDAPGGPESLDAVVGIQDRVGEPQFEAAAIHTNPETARQALGQLMTRPSSFAQLWDDGTVAQKYGFAAGDLPAVVVIDNDGYVAFEGRGLEAMNGAEARLRELLGMPPRVF